MSLTSHSLANLEFSPHDDHIEEAEEIELEIDAPNLISFNLDLLGYDLFPKLSFKSIPPKMKSNIHIAYREEVSVTLIPENLSNLVPSEISIDIDVFTKDGLNEDVSLVESFAGPLLDCCPKTILLHLSINKWAVSVVGYLQRKLEEMQNQQDLIKEFRWSLVHMNGEECQLQPLDFQSLSDDGCKEYGKNKGIRFELEWNPPSCSSK